MSARLDCPLCGATVAEGVEEITPGACPSCGAGYEGGNASAPDAVRTALMGFGAGSLDPVAVTDAVFRLTPADARERGVAITSDERDGFYRWWLFVRSGDDGGPAAVLAGV